MKHEAPDILCIQETKCQENDVPKVQCEVTFSWLRSRKHLCLHRLLELRCVLKNL